MDRLGFLPVIAGGFTRGRLAGHFFRALRIMGPNTSRAITRMMSTSQIMGYGTGTRRVSSSTQPELPTVGEEVREFFDPVLDKDDGPLVAFIHVGNFLQHEKPLAV